MPLGSAKFPREAERAPAEMMGLDQEVVVARLASARMRRASSDAILMSPEIMWYCPLPRSETNSPRTSSTRLQISAARVKAAATSGLPKPRVGIRQTPSVFCRVKHSFPQRSSRSVAHHYTEAARIEETIGYWLKAGKRAMQRSANIEAEGLHASLMARLDRLGPATGEAFRE